MDVFRHHVIDFGGARFGVAAKRSDHLGPDDFLDGGRLASETNHLPCLAERSLPRHTPKVGAEKPHVRFCAGGAR